MIKEIVLVGIGGGFGSIIRFLTSKLSFQIFPVVFPVGTFIVNILGCFLIGVLLGLSVKNAWIDNEGRYLLIVGFCGGFTTFSTLSVENLNLYNGGSYSILISYVVSSIILGFLAVWLGFSLTK